MVKAAMLINKTITNEFRICKGLRQRDPLSPFLFILVIEVLHLMLDKANELGLVRRINHVIVGQTFIHIQFADDIILFLRMDEEVVCNTKHILRCFEIFF